MRTWSVPAGPGWAGARVAWACWVGGASTWAGADGGADDVALASAGWSRRLWPQATSCPAGAHGAGSARRAETVSHTSPPPLSTTSDRAGNATRTWSPASVTGTVDRKSVV